MEVTLEVRLGLRKRCLINRFNPYSNGSYSGRLTLYMSLRHLQCVSILILMEVTLEADVEKILSIQTLYVSILILMEVTLEEEHPEAK